MKIENSNLYIATIAISIILLIIFYYFETEISEIMINISCSILAASILAVFIDEMNLKREIKEKNKFKKIYFEEINNHLSLILGEILWFEEHKNDDFIDWNWDIELFLDLRFRVHASKYYKEKEITFEEAITMLNDICDKYTKDKILEMKDDEKFKISKMFYIISFECLFILERLNEFDKNKLFLDSENYLKLTDLNRLLHDMKLCYTLMSKPEKNYGFAIHLLISSAKTIRQLGNYNNNIKVSVNESYVDITKIL
ncbi:MAG: hypothetical protein PUD86_02945 [Methanobacteriaceae archaeon]|nr:hypothetical protein [Methanobacteriaceae archaeon]